MRIGDLAERCGVSARSLRHYEAKGLLLSERTSGGHRRYGDGAVDRVILIQELLAAGLSTAVIAGLLPCIYSGFTTPAMVTQLEQQREKIDRKARELMSTRDRLDSVLAEARHRLAS